MSITSVGIGSGIDIQGLVNKLIAAEGQAPSQRLDTQETLLQAQLSAFGSLKGALATFQSKVQTAANFDSYLAKSANVSNAAVLSANVTNDAALGSHNVEVFKLAQAHSIASANFAGLDSTVSTGTLTIEFGTDNGGGSFTANPDKSAQTLTIDSSNNTLAGVRDAINAAGMGVNASIVYNGSSYQLVVTSNDTGAKNSLKLTGISELTYDPTNAGSNTMTQTVAAQDAEATIDGVAVTSATNTIQNVIQGLSLTLKQTNIGSPTNISINQNTGKAFDAVKAFVEGYNDLMKTVNTIAGYDKDKKAGGPLQGDPTVRTIVQQLQRIISTPVDGLHGKYRFVGEIGMATQNDGTLSLDEDKLRQAIKEDPAAVGRIFAAGASVSDSLMQYSGSSDKTQTGNFDIYINSVTAGTPATAGTYTGNWTSFLNPNSFSATIGNNENNFTVQVNGVLSNLITLTNGTYTSGSSLATEIQTQINADANLASSGESVTVSYEGDTVNGLGRFVMTSNKTGATSDIQFNAAGQDAQVEGNLGFGAGIAANVAGTDAVSTTLSGTLGGYAFTQDGDYLLGATGTRAEGLKIKYLGGGTGYRGTVSFSRGMASQLDSMLSGLLADGGVFSTRTQIYNDSIADIGKQRDALNLRLQTLQDTYYTEFNAMDTLVAQLTSTGNYLKTQLAALPGARTTSSSK